jgi:hypothetical protein
VGSPIAVACTNLCFLKRVAFSVHSYSHQILFGNFPLLHLFFSYFSIVIKSRANTYKLSNNNTS